MPPYAPPDGMRYTATITNVREVAIYGTANLDFWRMCLRPHGLFPAAATGSAQIVISASALAWKGLIFRELVVSVATCADPDHAQLDSFYLAQAFNSSRLMAWAERRMFQCPYDHSAIHVDAATPLIDVRHNRRPLFRAQMPQLREPSARGDEKWAGPVFLPPLATRQKAGGPLFFVAFSGEQAAYPFVPSTDSIEITPSSDHPVFQWLCDSNFTATEWRIRANATHARSKTYRRGVV